MIKGDLLRDFFIDSWVRKGEAARLVSQNTLNSANSQGCNEKYPVGTSYVDLIKKCRGEATRVLMHCRPNEIYMIKELMEDWLLSESLLIKNTSMGEIGTSRKITTPIFKFNSKNIDPSDEKIDVMELNLLLKKYIKKSFWNICSDYEYIITNNAKEDYELIVRRVVDFYNIDLYYRCRHVFELFLSNSDSLCSIMNERIINFNIRKYFSKNIKYQCMLLHLSMMGRVNYIAAYSNPEILKELYSNNTYPMVLISRKTLERGIDPCKRVLWKDRHPQS